LRRRRQPNVRLTSEPQLGAEVAQASVASRKLRDNRRVWFKRLLALLFFHKFLFNFIGYVLA